MADVSTTLNLTKEQFDHLCEIGLESLGEQYLYRYEQLLLNYLSSTTACFHAIVMEDAPAGYGFGDSGCDEWCREQLLAIGTVHYQRYLHYLHDEKLSPEVACYRTCVSHGVEVVLNTLKLSEIDP